MKAMWAACAVIVASAPAVAQEVSVPSGHAMALYDVILEDDTQTARFRFHVPAIGGPDPLTFSDVVADFQYLCDTLVIPGLAANGWAAKDIVISMSAEQVDFGQITAEVAQFFQPFRVENDTCIWEDF